MSDESEFSFSKWYLDCVGAGGRALVGYAATLRFKLAAIHYSSVATFGGAGRRLARMSLRPIVHPEVSAGAITWSPRAIALDGRWIPRLPPVEKELYASERGSVRWRCVLPSGNADVSLGGGERIEGLGYVERIDLTLPPWELPIRELRWGRFLTPTDSVVWIEWRGDAPLTLVLLGGIEAPGGSVADDAVEIESAGCVLSLSERRVLREGPILSTALRGIPGVRRLFPSGILRASECKWISRGRLTRAGRPPVEGWALHELVRFE